MHIDVLNLRSAPLAIAPEAAGGFLAHLDDLSPRALEARRATKADLGERLGRRGDVGVLYAVGVMVKHDTWLSRALGLTTYAALRRDLQAALDDPAVKSIVLYVDSPGGEASGCDELAKAIFEARQRKHITAFVSGMAASGGYWLASAARRVVVSDAAVLGSIGVAMAVRPKSGSTMEFVSSQSPGKRPDATTDAGKARLQTMVDDLADVFIKSVVMHRGVSHETVVKRFGEGGVKVGAKAVAAGMADSVGQFEAVLASLRSGAMPARTMAVASAPAETITVAAQPVEPTPAQMAHAMAQVKAELEAAARKRIETIVNSEPGQRCPNLAKHLAHKTTLSVDDALAQLKAEDAAIAATWRKATERQNAGI